MTQWTLKVLHIFTYYPLLLISLNRVSQKIEVLLPDGGTSYYIKLDEAKHLTATNQAIWDGPKRLIRRADESKRGMWVPKMSGDVVVLQLR